jgi:hypothetical protein
MRSTLNEDQYTYLLTSHSFLLKMRNVSNKSCTENQNTHFVFNNIFPENRAVYEITWKNMVQPDGLATDDNMTHCMVDN